MLDHGQGLAGVAVDDHGHVAMPFAHRSLIDQQHRAPATAAVLGHTARPCLDHTVDEVPPQSVAPCRRPQRHDPRVRDEPARQAPRQLGLELGMVLEIARRAVVAHEPAPQPHQRRVPPRHLQIAHLAPAGVAHPHAGHLDRPTVDSTSTLNSLGVPDTTASTRVSRRCNRTRLEFEAIGALLDR